jgi:predicted alpha/beta superfamily hydrolase
MHELNPFDNPEFGKAEGEEYTAFILKVLKPWVDQHYRTRPERRHTAIMGSHESAWRAEFPRAIEWLFRRRD